MGLYKTLEVSGWFCFQELILQLLCRQRTLAWSQSTLLKVSEQGTWAHKCANTGLWTFFPSGNTGWATSAFSQRALGIHLTAGEEQCHFDEQCQVFTRSAQDLPPPLIKGNAIGAAAIGNHDPFSHPNKVSEAGGAQVLFPAWNAQGDSWLLLHFCFWAHFFWAASWL